MSVVVKFDKKGFKQFQEQLEKLEKGGIQEFCEGAVKELAARMLEKVIEKTPVGEYGTKQVHFVTREGKEVNFTANSSKMGGTLRRGWTIGEIIKKGNSYIIEVINPVNYASYVEYGHRTREKIDGTRGWVEGRFMMTISEEELQEEAHGIIEQRLQKFLEEQFK